MININNSLTANTIYTTASGITLNLINKSSNVDSIIVLPNNESIYDRYSKYTLSPINYSGLSVGLYSYILSGASINEVGLLTVNNNDDSIEESIDNTYTSIPTISTDDDYIIYNN